MKISFPSRNDRCVGTRARVRSSPSRRRLARASRSRARAIDDDVILPSFPSPFASPFTSRDSSRRVPIPHRHLDTVPRSVGRAGDADAISRRRRKAPAGVVVARRAHVRDDADEERGRRGGRRRETPTARRPAPSRFARRETRARVISTSECHPPAHTRERRAGHPFDARVVVRRPSSSRRVAREYKKTGARRVPRSPDSRVRSFARARATMCGATTAREAAVSSASASARRFASFFYTCAWIPR